MIISGRVTTQVHLSNTIRTKPRSRRCRKNGNTEYKHKYGVIEDNY